MSEEQVFPSWRYGPNEQAEIFQSAEEIPAGWRDHPSLVADITPPDLDGDGKPGGSIAPEPTDRLKELRDEYRALAGKKPFAGWDEAELETRIAALKTPAETEEAPAETVEIDTTEF